MYSNERVKLENKTKNNNKKLIEFGSHSVNTSPVFPRCL